MVSDIYLEKARESLASAQSELDNRRYNCSANRSYYACFQAAIFALLQIGVRRSRSGKWRHEYVKGQFATELIHRHKRYPAELAVTLERCFKLREQADYEDYPVSKPQAERQFRAARTFVQTIEGGETV